MGQDKPGRDISAELDKKDPHRWGPDPVFHTTVTITASRPKSSWQQERVIKHLKEMYPDGFPAKYSPGRLLAALAKRDPQLKWLDRKTLRRALAQVAKSGIKP
jgi:hypothetical protein